MHTPRLCIDGRAAEDFKAKGLVAQEVIDQLVAGIGEEGASSEWLEKSRTVLLSHPKQVFSGQLKRYNTRKKIRKSPLHWFWENQFIKKANISLLHQFRPVDKLQPSLQFSTLTTLLSPKNRLPFFISRKPNNKYIVPSPSDCLLLEKQYQMPREQVYIFTPSVRRYVHFVENFNRPPMGHILFLVANKNEASSLKKLQQIIKERYPNLTQKIIYLNNKTSFSPKEWVKILQNTQLCFYLNSLPFDWATLALETFFWEVPIIYSDKSEVLNSLLPDGSLKLSQYLINQPSIKEIEEKTIHAKTFLEEQGVFEPFAFAKQYRNIYSTYLNTN